MKSLIFPLMVLVTMLYGGKLNAQISEQVHQADTFLLQLSEADELFLFKNNAEHHYGQCPMACKADTASVQPTGCPFRFDPDLCPIHLAIYRINRSILMARIR